jgi:hypothetical protein
VHCCTSHLCSQRCGSRVDHNWGSSHTRTTEQTHPQNSRYTLRTAGHSKVSIRRAVDAV